MCTCVRASAPAARGYVIREGRGLWSLFFWLRRPFGLREGEMVVQSKEDLSNLQVSAFVWPFRSTNFVLKAFKNNQSMERSGQQTSLWTSAQK